MGVSEDSLENTIEINVQKTVHLVDQRLFKMEFIISAKIHYLVSRKWLNPWFTLLQEMQ